MLPALLNLECYSCFICSFFSDHKFTIRLQSRHALCTMPVASMPLAHMNLIHPCSMANANQAQTARAILPARACQHCRRGAQRGTWNRKKGVEQPRDERQVGRVRLKGSNRSALSSVNRWSACWAPSLSAVTNRASVCVYRDALMQFPAAMPAPFLPAHSTVNAIVSTSE